jgi:RNA polymerase sigma-70 factor (ECF subfamily)
MKSDSALLFTGFTCGMNRFMNVSPSVVPADEELVRLARAGDTKAFEALAERHQQKAYHIAFGFVRDREEAKDLSQDAFLKAFMNLKNFDGRSGFYTWFYRILVNVCLDHKRRRSGRANEEFNEAVENQVEPSHPSAVTATPDKAAMASQLARKVGAALDKLPANQRTAFILKNHQGLSIKEIADVMETAEGTVKVHLHRAVRALREKLAEFAS